MVYESIIKLIQKGRRPLRMRSVIFYRFSKKLWQMMCLNEIYDSFFKDLLVCRKRFVSRYPFIWKIGEKSFLKLPRESEYHNQPFMQRHPRAQIPYAG